MAMLRQLPKLAIIMKINLASRNAMPQQPNTP